MPRGIPGSGPKKTTKKKAAGKGNKRTYNRKANIESVNTPTASPSTELINIEMKDGTRVENVSVESAMKFIQLLNNQKNGKTAS
jgi:hypothetical protein